MCLAPRVKNQGEKETEKEILLQTFQPEHCLILPEESLATLLPHAWFDIINALLNSLQIASETNHSAISFAICFWFKLMYTGVISRFFGLVDIVNQKLRLQLFSHLYSILYSLIPIK